MTEIILGICTIVFAVDYIIVKGGTSTKCKKRDVKDK